MAGNFNLTNVGELFNSLVELGQTPVDFSDTVTILENVGHRLDEENERVFRFFKEQGYSKREITPLIEKNLDLGTVLPESKPELGWRIRHGRDGRSWRCICNEGSGRYHGLHFIILTTKWLW